MMGVEPDGQTLFVLGLALTIVGVYAEYGLTAAIFSSGTVLIVLGLAMDVQEHSTSLPGEKQ